MKQKGCFPFKLAVLSASLLIVARAASAADFQLSDLIYRNDSQTGTFTKQNTSLIPSANYTQTGLTNGTQYWYKASAVDTTGNESVLSAAVSVTPTAPTAPQPPSGVICGALPAPSGTIVNVNTVSQLQNAVADLQSNTTIVIAAGTYNLTTTMYLPQNNVNNWAIRGATNNRGDVVLKGAGMTGAIIYGFWMQNATNGLIANLTIDGVKSTGIMLNPGSNNITIYNVAIIDAGDQHVKSNPSNGYGTGNDNGVVQCSDFRFRTNEQGAGDTANYTNGVDVHGGSKWLVQYNHFENFRQPSGLAGAAVLMWNGSGIRGANIVDGNTFFNNDTNIALGLTQRPEGRDNMGGTISNNMIARPAGSGGDVGIQVVDSPNTQIVNNTILLNGTYPRAIEYRYLSTTGLRIQNNLTDAGITARDGAGGNSTISNNVTNAASSLYVNPATGDLHLKATASSAIDSGIAIAGLTNDIDGEARPSGSAFDIGADEFGGTTPPPTNQAPTVATPASGNPNPVTGTTANLSVLGADDGGENLLRYEWTQQATPPQSPAVTFSGATNNTNQAKNIAATFGKAGQYTLRVTIRDQQNASVTSDVNVTVNQTPTTVNVNPNGNSVLTNTTLQFTATAKDQFGNNLASQPSFTWSVPPAAGTINNSGLFTAGNNIGGPFDVRATAGSIFGTASVSVTNATPPNNVRITAPANNASYTTPANITLTATANAGSNSLLRIDFLANGNVIGSDSSNPYSFTWNNVPAGDYDLTAHAVDDAGNAGVSPMIHVTVNAPANVPPTVSLALSNNSQPFIAPASIGLTATASDSDGSIARVEFYRGAQLLAQDTSTPYNFGLTGVAAGDYTFTCKATDNQGAETTSSPVTVTVNAAPSNPGSPGGSPSSGIGGIVRTFNPTKNESANVPCDKDPVNVIDRMGIRVDSVACINGQAQWKGTNNDGEISAAGVYRVGKEKVVLTK